MFYVIVKYYNIYDCHDMLRCSKLLAVYDLPNLQTICAARCPSWASTPSVSAHPFSAWP